MINYQQKQLEHDLLQAGWQKVSNNRFILNRSLRKNWQKDSDSVPVHFHQDENEVAEPALTAYAYKQTKAKSADLCKLKIMYGVGQLSHLLALKLGLSEWKDSELDDFGWKVIIDDETWKVVYRRDEFGSTNLGKEEAINHEITQNALKREIGNELAKMMFWACRYMSSKEIKQGVIEERHSVNYFFLSEVALISDIASNVEASALCVWRTSMSILALAEKLEIDLDKHFEEILA